MTAKILMHNEIKKVSRPVENFETDVLPYIDIMAQMCRRKVGNKTGLAIAHCQIEFGQDDPLTFYVLANGDAIINPKIIKVSEKSLVLSREGCLSFPDKKDVLVKRYSRIKASYGIYTNGKLLYKSKWLEDRAAFVMQHEIDHFNLKYIYDGEPK
jgi:peptide deformylase